MKAELSRTVGEAVRSVSATFADEGLFSEPFHRSRRPMRWPRKHPLSIGPPEKGTGQIRVILITALPNYGSTLRVMNTCGSPIKTDTGKRSVNPI
jgi:hypothetical protein